MSRLTGSKAVEFKIFAPQAKKVILSGSFNKWDTRKLTAKKDARGNWLVKTSLKPGRHEYKFLVDGSWWNDPKCSACIPNAFGTQNCVIDVR